jgi:hypothetical protein
MRASASGSSSPAPSVSADAALAEVGDHRGDAAAARDRDAVPAALAVVRQLVAEVAELRGRRVRVVSFVSCIISTSGRARSSHQRTLSRRARSELTFQVAIRIAN